MTAKQQKANGGWIQNVSVTKRNRYTLLDNWTEQSLKSDYIDYFEDYRTRYFYDRILPGQGLEEILFTLQKQSDIPSNWIDLGAGVVSLFWSMALDTSHLKAIDVCDLMPEALYVLHRFIKSQEIPPCYHEALAFLGRDKSYLTKNRTIPWSYHSFNCLENWSIPKLSHDYDLVTAIGCFGLSKKLQDYRIAVRSAANHLSDRGRFIGVDWVRSSLFIEEEQHDNSYLNCDFISMCAQDNDLYILHLEEVKIHDDPYYDRLIIWSFSR